MSLGDYGYCPHKESRAGTGYDVKRDHRIKTDMIIAYGDKCIICGETHYNFLGIDHVNGGGTKHRESIGGSGRRFYAWLKRQGWPKDSYRLLCSNCNCSRKYNTA